MSGAPKYDVLVAGGGVAGLFLAYLTARAGFTVAIVEMKSEEKVGEKVCGDAVGEHHFREVGLEPPRLGLDAVGVFEGVRVYSPSKRYFVTARGKGYALDRKAFGRRLLKIAADAGAELLASHAVVKPIVEGEWVKGLRVRGPEGLKDLYSRVVVDATGAAAAVRTRLPSQWWVAYRAPLEDFNAAYRVIAEVEEEQDPRYALIYLDAETAPGGYWWWFPKGEHVVNVGLGVRPDPGAPNPKENLYKYVIPELEKADAKIAHEGGGIVPTRRPLSCMVWNGLVAVGDAACTANPIHGGGIGPALVSSFHAASTIAQALEEGEATLEALWPYHKAYIGAYGEKQAGLDALRIFLQSLGNDDLNFVLEEGIVSDEDLGDIGYKAKLSAKLIGRLLAGLKLLARPTLLRDIVAVKDYMEAVARLYREFPDTPKDFPRWRERQESLFLEMKKRFWG